MLEKRAEQRGQNWVDGVQSPLFQFPVVSIIRYAIALSIPSRKINLSATFHTENPRVSPHDFLQFSCPIFKQSNIREPIENRNNRD